MKNSNEKFRKLTTEEVVDYQKSARDNYEPGQPISSAYHPVYRLECEKMNVECVQIETGSYCY